MTDRRRGLLSFALTGSLGLLCAGCGAGLSSTPPAVAVAVTAPISGATVGVRAIDVSGTVAPAGARVVVAGHTATVRGGAFLAPLRLTSARTRIQIVASARGYRPASLQTTVRYQAGAAGAPLASTGQGQGSAGDDSATKTGSRDGHPASGSSSRAPASHPVAATTPAVSTTTPAVSTTTAAPAAGPAGAAGAAAAATASSGHAPALRLHVTAAERQSLTAGCVSDGETASVCGCIVDAISASPVFDSEAAFLDAVAELRTAFTSRNAAALGAALRTTIATAMRTCAVAPHAGSGSH